MITLEMLRRRNVPVTDVLNIYTDQAAGLQFLGCFDWNDVIASNGAGSQTVSQRVCANAQYDRAPMLVGTTQYNHSPHTTAHGKAVALGLPGVALDRRQ